MFKWFAFLTAWLWLPTAFSAQEPVLSLSQASDRLAAGGYVLMMRHAIAPGTGDPAGFSVDNAALILTWWLTQITFSLAGKRCAAW